MLDVINIQKFKTEQGNRLKTIFVQGWLEFKEPLTSFRENASEINNKCAKREK